MKIVNLGTSHGDPTATRYQSSTLIETGGKYYLVDAGEPVSASLIRRGIIPANLTAVFITHMHVDHTGGLPVLIEQSMKYQKWIKSPMPKFLIPDEKAIAPLKNWLCANQIVDVMNLDTIQTISPQKGYDDGNLCVRAFSNGHLDWCAKGLGSNSYCLKISAEGKQVFFTGDLASDYADLPVEAADGCDLMFSELTHFPIEKALPVLEKLHLGKLIFYHLMNPWQTQQGRERAQELCKGLAYPVELAFDGMETTL